MNRRLQRHLNFLTQKGRNRDHEARSNRYVGTHQWNSIMLFPLLLLYAVVLICHMTPGPGVNGLEESTCIQSCGCLSFLQVSSHHFPPM